MIKYRDYFSGSPPDVLKALAVTHSGLNAEDVALRIGQYGYNEVEREKLGWARILARQVNSFFNYFLLVAAGINIFLGEFVDAGLIIIFILINGITGFYQEYKAENAIAHLHTFLSRYVRVRRNDEIVKINIRELVPGDIVFFSEGDLIPADVRFVRTKGCLVDESVLTGESVPVAKSSAAMPDAAIISDLDADNIGFSGSTVVEGWGEAVVIATGTNTYFAEVFEKMIQIEKPSLFEQNIKKVGTFLAYFMILLAGVVFFAKIFITGRFDLNFLVFIVALVVALIPEALPIVTTLAFSKGSLALAKKNVVIKRLTALEDLGSVDVLCTDKTGTITSNNLTVRECFTEKHDLFLQMALISSLAGKKTGKLYNPFDKAIAAYAGDALRDDIHATVAFIDDVPFDPIQRANEVLCEREGKRFVVVRGAPEVIMENVTYYCDSAGAAQHADAAYRKNAMQWFQESSKKGMRVLAVGFKYVDAALDDLKNNTPGDLVFAGFVSFSDPLKETSQEAFVLMQRLGIDLKIITGDSAAVAGAVGHQLGLVDDPQKVLTGAAFESMNAMEKKEAVHAYHIFARTLPMHKYEIIELLQQDRTVGFLGEGYNDVAALKIVDLALVVENASDMARSVADVILLKDDLLVIAQGIEEGRRIFANIVKYIRTTLAANIGNFFTLMAASFVLPFLPILPLQVLMLNLIADFPMIAISVDAVSPVELQKPQRYDLRSLYAFVIIFGIVTTPFDFIFFGMFSRFGASILQTGWFFYNVLQDLFAFFSMRTLLPIYRGGMPAKGILSLSGIALVSSIILLMLPSTRGIFHFASLAPHHFAIIALILAAYLAVNEIMKKLYVRLKNIGE